MATKQETGDVSLAYSYTKNAWADMDARTLSRFARFLLRAVYETLLNERGQQPSLPAKRYERKHPSLPAKGQARRNSPRDAILDYLEVFLPPFHNWYAAREANLEDPVHLHRNSRSMEIDDQFDRVFPSELQIRIAEAALRSIVSAETEIEVLSLVRGTDRKLPATLITNLLLTLTNIAAKDREAVPFRYQKLLDALLEENAAEAQARQSEEANAQEEELQKAQRLLSKAGWTVYPPPTKSN